MIDSNFITKEKDMDIKIENVVRTVQEKVLLFYNEYRKIFDAVRTSPDAIKDIRILGNFSTNLKLIRKMFLKEKQDFAEENKELQSGLNKVLYEQVLLDLGRIDKDLESYINNLDIIISESNNGKKSDEDLKAGFEGAFAILHAKYNDFITSDDDVIAKLNKIKDIGWKKYLN